jgi:uncharacterized membrane protein
MATSSTFDYHPLPSELEKASNAYLMSLIALMAGMPLPILNLLATLIFFWAQRRGSYFVRWHVMQALLSQFVLLFFNSYLFWWVIDGLMGQRLFGKEFWWYLGFVLVFNTIEWIATIYTTIMVRKGHHIRWLVMADMCDAFVKKQMNTYK